MKVSQELDTIRSVSGVTRALQVRNGHVILPNAQLPIGNRIVLYSYHRRVSMGGSDEIDLIPLLALSSL